ncbi:MAG: phage portal protein [Roseburia sp.]|nr:phage portal protein [Roseburia sp.]
MYIPSCNIEKSGIPRIEIPVRLRELDEEVLKHYLPKCVTKLKQNAKKIQYLKKFTDGTYQEIDDRLLEIKTSGNANHKIKENHAYEIVQFKEGFRLGNKRQLVNKEGIENNDVSYIEKFMTDAGCESKIMEWVHDLYSTGIATTFIMQRGDIFSDSGEGENRKVTYLPADDYDVKVNAPFVYETVNCEENAVVYSSCIGESGLKDLFCINIANVWNRDTNQTEEVVTVYTRQKVYEWRNGYGQNELKEIGNNLNAIYGELPMTEHSLNKTRISPVEVIYDMLNAVNLLVSLEMNSAEDKVNQLLVFLNCNLKDDDGDDVSIDEMYKNGAIAVTGSVGDRAADVKAITNELDYTQTSVLKEQLLTRMFDIIGVPLASASVSSGNNEAAYLGGGWTNANIIMNRDIVYGERSEREELRKIIKICKLNANNPVQSIHANEIDIKYNINQSNNYVAKSQAMQNLNDIGFDIADIIKAIPFFGDEEGVAKRCKENQEKKAEQEKEKASQSQQTALTGDNLAGQQKQQQADQTTAEQAKGVQ